MKTATAAFEGFALGSSISEEEEEEEEEEDEDEAKIIELDLFAILEGPSVDCVRCVAEGSTKKTENLWQGGVKKNVLFVCLVGWLVGCSAVLCYVFLL